MLTEQQRARRRNGIGGSDIPIILGLSSYMTPYQLYLDKKGLLEREPETELQRWGNLLEPVIRNEFATRHDVVVETPDTLTHPLIPYLIANVDGLVPSMRAVLEVKTANPYQQKEWDDAMSDGMPLAYMAQVAHYCAVTGYDKAYLAVLIGTHDYREYVYERQQDIEDTIYKAAELFWEGLQSNVEPDLRTVDDVRLRYKATRPEPKTASLEVEQCLFEIAKAKETTKEMESRMEKLKFEVMQYMQESDCLVDSEGKPLATWKANKKGARMFLVKGAA